MLGRTIGNYQIIELVGRGGMGEVYRAEHHSRAGIRVAIKMLLPEISAHRPLVERFFNEANAVSLIKHASIVRIFDLGYFEDRAYLVMELLEGMSLADALKRHGPIPTPHALEYGRQVASAVYAAHAANIIHRDLKPDNLFLIEDHELASGKRVKVLDFGIAKLSDTRTISGHTVGMMGTPAYMPPEQWQDAGTVDTRSDVYALGCLLYEMVCGAPPFPGKTMPEYCTQHLAWPPPSPRAVNQTLPPDFDALIVAMMAKDRAQRPQSMHDVDLVLEAIQNKRGLHVALDKRRLSGDVPSPRLDARGAATPGPTGPGGYMTTLSSGAGEPTARSGRGVGLMLGVGALALTGAVVGVLATRDSSSKDSSSQEPSAPTHATRPREGRVAEEEPPETTPPQPGSSASGVVRPADKPANRWVRIDTSASILLGVSAEQVEAGELGFAAVRGVRSPREGFEIQAHEVTWGELATAGVAGAAGHDADLPATGVPWAEARAYCALLDGDLPREAQWELAARGLDARPNPWGAAPAQPSDLGAYRGAGGTVDRIMTHAIDRTPGSDDEAIYDLAGNAQEWTADPWTEDSSDTPPAWASEGGRGHVAIRGLPVIAPPPPKPPAMSATYRDALCASGACPDGTDAARAVVGFRCARPAR